MFKHPKILSGPIPNINITHGNSPENSPPRNKPIVNSPRFFGGPSSFSHHMAVGAQRGPGGTHKYKFDDIEIIKLIETLDDLHTSINNDLLRIKKLLLTIHLRNNEI